MYHEWDTGTGINYNATIGERNNNTIATTLMTGANPANIVNLRTLRSMCQNNY